MMEDSYYDKQAADYAVSFIESLCHTKGRWAGKPFELIDWQEQIVRDLFGILKLAEGDQRSEQGDSADQQRFG